MLTRLDGSILAEGGFLATNQPTEIAPVLHENQAAQNGHRRELPRWAAEEGEADRD